MKKKLLVLLLTATLCLGSALTVAAAPKTTQSSQTIIYDTSVTKSQLSIIRKLFNAKDYASMYPDVAKAYGNDEEALWKHFVRHGLAEGRNPNKNFNVFAYRAAYKDLQKAFGNNLAAYYVHFESFGSKEKRTIVTLEAAEKAGIEVTNIRGKVISKKSASTRSAAFSTPTPKVKATPSPKASASPKATATPTPTASPQSVSTPKPTATPKPHSHVYNVAVPSTTENTHSFKCKCGKADSAAPVSCKDENKDDKCDVCGKVLSQKCEHEWIATDNGDTHFYKCSKCGQTDTSRNAQEHSYTKYESVSETQHKVMCSVCGKEKSLENHFYKDHVCEKCGSNETVLHTHNIQYISNEDGTHTSSCAETVGTCDYMPQVDDCSLQYTSNGNGTHVFVCSKNCGYKGTEDCTISDGVCEKCNYEPQHVHNYGTPVYAEDHYHQTTCSTSNCPEKTVKEPCTLSYKEKDETYHITTCSVCGFSAEEVHDNNESCSLCNYHSAGE